LPHPLKTFKPPISPCYQKKIPLKREEKLSTLFPHKHPSHPPLEMKGGVNMSTTLPTSPHLKNNSLEKGKKLFPFFSPRKPTLIIYNLIHSTYFHYLALYTLNPQPLPISHQSRNKVPFDKWKTSSFKPT